MPTPHLLGLQGAPRGEIVSLLRAARAMSERIERADPALQRALAGRVVANLFFEDSTRTRMSFTVAAKRLGAEVIDLLGSNSSVSKGETLIDTARNIEAMGVGALVVRAKQAGAAALIASRVAVPVLNAGDGRHEHPTQGLLDAYSLAEAHGRLDGFDLAGLRVAIVGDVAASRVARSAIAAMSALGAQVTCVGSASLAPRALEGLGCAVTDDLDGVLPALDAVMMLRIQFERYDAASPASPGSPPPRPNVIASVREYRARFALTQARADRMKPGAIVMHPGPINRGLELDAEVADGPRSVILRQVSNGVAVRMAVLERLLTAPR
ncbi:MAG TPA: aspartate carbamoyltransferase catalytic subunit [Phycisphaerales bacterium]|nr:aspartate carbamoyltransferase catalytic subunit [Phycisphaerales bacterium]